MRRLLLIKRKKVLRWSFLPLIVICILLTECKDSDDSETNEPTSVTLPAFPGAEGFGSVTAGGRGGRIIEVTNLFPSGPGSFTAACEATYPRIVVFRTGGTIKVKSPIKIKSPYITIAGQTAPGDGICIRGAALTIATHDVIVRGLRIRVGDDPDGPEGESRDGLTITNQSNPPYNIIIDHCSVSWAIDENMDSWNPAHDITIQWCISSEGLDSSLHVKGPHSKGMLIGPDTKRISIHHNLFAHNVERNPLISVDTESEVINNVIYNWKSRGLNLGNCYPEHGEKSNVIGNYFKKGPNSNTIPFQVSDCWKNSKVYVKGNIGPGRLTDTGDEWALVRNDVGSQIISSVSVIESLMKTIHPVSEVYDITLAYAGALIPKRDPVDNRIIGDVKNGTGKIINSQEDVGGWPTYDPGIPPVDTDHDGMPDEWETSHGLDPNNPADRHLINLSTEGYTNIEVYLNGLLNSP